MSFVYPHFDFYYITYNKSILKPADSLVLFYHWYLVHNKFKCLVDNKVKINFKLKCKYQLLNWLNFSQLVCCQRNGTHQKNITIYSISNVRFNLD